MENYYFKLIFKIKIPRKEIMAYYVYSYMVTLLFTIASVLHPLRVLFTL